MENVDINTLYQIILEIALEELALAMCEYKGETSEDFKNCSGDIYSYFDIWCNCLDTRLTYIGENELLGKEIQDKMRNACIKSYNKFYEVNTKLKEKQKGRNQDINVKDMSNYTNIKKQLAEKEKKLEKANKQTKRRKRKHKSSITQV